ncbi:MAG: hypothetical protein ACLQDC_09580 [Verrucomicrobiia bacterium]
MHGKAAVGFGTGDLEITLHKARTRVIGLQERRLGRTVLRTYRAKVDIDDVLPNERQPRMGPKEDDELQR